MELHHVIKFLPTILAVFIYYPHSALAILYAQTLNLDFLCSAVEPNAYVRDIPWDCSSYVVCMSGQAITTECPQGKLYASNQRNSKCMPAPQVDSQRCHRRMWDYITRICRGNPTAKVPDPEGCSHFFDCTAVNSAARDLINYIVECPYPTLFSKKTGGCRDFRLVYCGERKEPKAPCEYLQYMQMYDCVGPNCVPCSRRHPSCVGRLNGPQFVPNRKDFMMECSNERTVKITSIASSPSSSSSSPSSSSSVVETSLSSSASSSDSSGSSISISQQSSPSSSSQLLLSSPIMPLSLPSSLSSFVAPAEEPQSVPPSSSSSSSSSSYAAAPLPSATASVSIKSGAGARPGSPVVKSAEAAAIPPTMDAAAGTL